MDIDKQNNKQAQQTIHEAREYHKVWTGAYLLLAIACLCLYLLVHFGVLDNIADSFPAFKRVFPAGCLIFTVLAISKYAQALIVKYTHVEGISYNLVMLVRILALLTVIMIGVAFAFENWYTAAVSLGLFSLILGFALQTPISSLIGWLYIIIRTPYKVGDRIQVGDFRGDVVEIGYLDTTLWEFRGDYLTNDLPSGRLIRFPNTIILQSEVYNYSWGEFPYIWNELPFHIAYESDFAYVEEVLRATAKEILGPGMEDKVKELKQMIQETPIDELTIREYPFVTFRTNSNTWIEASVNYLVDPKKASAIRSAIVKKAVATLLQQPDRVMFPKSNSR